MALDEDIELVKLPSSGTFKVVQLFVGDKPVMVCGTDNSFHCQILEKYLVSQRLSFESTQRSGRELPNLDGENYHVVGMGVAVLYPEVNYFHLPHGTSADYRIGPSSDFEERLKQQFPGWKFELKQAGSADSLSE